jgi:O-Antigen ligase
MHSDLHSSLLAVTPLRAWLWLTVASSFAVNIEPAACDLLGAGLLVTAFAAGLRVPSQLALPALLLGLFLLGNLIGSALAPDPAASVLPFAIRGYLLLGWWLLVSSLLSPAPKLGYNVLWSAYVVAAVITGTLGTLAFFGAIPDNGQLVDDGRVRALFKDPNVYGPFLVPAMILALQRMESSPALHGVLWLILFGILGLGLVLGFSRGSWLNFLVAALCFLAFRLQSERTPRAKQRLRAAVTGMFVIAVAVVAAALTVPSVQEMMEVRAKVTQDYDTQSRVGGAKSRFDVQAETLQLAMQRPLGIGAGQSEMDYNQGKAPHNLFLHTLVEAGWLGGLAFYAFVALTLWVGGRLLFVPSAIQGEYQVAYACLVGLLVQSLFVDTTHWRHFYFLLALLWGPVQFLRIQRRVAPLARDAHGQRLAFS